MSSSEENKYEGYNSEVVHITWHIDTGFVGADHSDTWVFDPGELPDNKIERNSLLDEMMEQEINNHISGYWEDN